MLQIYNKTTNMFIGVAYNDDKEEYRKHHKNYNQGAIWTLRGVIDGVKTVTHKGSEPTQVFAYREVSIDELRSEKRREINAVCKEMITNGFTSDALGDNYWYKNSEIDQLNLIGMVAVGEEDYLKCRLMTDANSLDYREHTAEQLKKVLSANKAQRIAYLKRASALKAKIENASARELSEIAW